MRTANITKDEMDNIVRLCTNTNTRISLSVDKNQVVATIPEWDREYYQNMDSPKQAFRTKSALVSTILAIKHKS